MKTLDLDQSVGQFALEHPESVGLLQRHRIEFCCGGRASLREALEQAGLSAGDLAMALEWAGEAPPPGEGDPRELSTEALLARIVGCHHAYLREALPLARGLALKVAGVHGDREPRLFELAETVGVLAESLLGHLDEEESKLFPAMAGGAAAAALQKPLRQMEEEHRAVGALLAEIRRDANDFHVPHWACSSYRALFEELEKVEQDVIAHVHLENNVLAPRFAG